MPFNGIGVFTVYTPGNPAVPGTAISSVAFNATMADFAAGLANTLTRDGQSPATANIPMGGNKITGLGPATVAGQAVRFEQLPTLATLGAAASGANADITSLNAPALGAATATTQASNDSSTKVATTAMVQAAAAVQAAAYGGAQTLQSLYGSRALSTTYTNSTGRPIFVMVMCSMPNGYMSGLVNGLNSDIRFSSGPAVTTAVTFMVPTGGTYSVSGGTLQQWLEIR